MEEKKVQAIVKNCVQLIDNSDTYEEGVNKVCEQYGIPYEDIYVSQNARNFLDISSKTADEILDILGSANNQAALVELFSGLQQKINQINSDLLSASVASSTGAINQNPQFHGFLFEEIHAAVFNMRAKMAGKPYVAMVLKPRLGGTYTKNSVDIGIYNFAEKHPLLQKYQLKCCADSDATIKAISHGDYHNQRLLVADGQASSVKKAFPTKTVTTCLEYDGISSNPITYSKAKMIQNAIQSGSWEAIDWNEFSNKDLFYAGLESLKTPILIDVLMRTVIGVGGKIVGQTEDSWIDVFKRIGLGILDDTSKLALSAAAQIVIKKEFAESVVGKLTAPEVYAIVSLAIDTTKELVKVAQGKQDIIQAMDNIAKKTVVAAAQLAGGAGGAALGGWLAGPVGAKIGYVVGSSGCGVLAGKVYDVVERMIMEPDVKKIVIKQTPLHEKLSEKNMALN